MYLRNWHAPEKSVKIARHAGFSASRDGDDEEMLAEELPNQGQRPAMTDLGLQLVSDLHRKHRLIEVFLSQRSWATDPGNPSRK